MDAYSRYNQIRMEPTDQEATTFVTDRGLFYYNVMPFGLKNTRATYQRLMNKMFAEQIGNIIEVYVDDMLVKSLKRENHIEHLETILDILPQYGIRLNPVKCFFCIDLSKLLGFLISKTKIEANLSKIQDVLNMSAPTTKDGILQLIGELNALSRFISQLTDRCAPFFKALKISKTRAIEWMPECEAAFQGIKEYLASIPKLYKPEEGETLYLYLAVSSTAVSAALIR